MLLVLTVPLLTVPLLLLLLLLWLWLPGLRLKRCAPCHALLWCSFGVNEVRVYRDVLLVRDGFGVPCLFCNPLSWRAYCERGRSAENDFDARSCRSHGRLVSCLLCWLNVHLCKRKMVPF